MIFFTKKEEICSRSDQRRGSEPIYKVAERQSMAYLRRKNFLALGGVPQRN